MRKLSFFRAREGRKPKVVEGSGVPPLSRWERFGALLVALGGAAVGGLGFYASFDAVSAKAEQWGFADPWVLPTAIDSAIPVFTGAYLLLIRLDMRLWWARLVPWALSLVTCALNVASGETLWSKVAHGAMSLLWVAVSEIAAHVYAVRIGAVTGRRRRLDKVRWSRWLLAPLPTFLLWRRMKLWELESYDTVLELEQDRLRYEAALRGKFGRGWRRKAPVEAVLPLRLARNGIPLAETAEAGLAAAGLEPNPVPSVRPVAAELEAPKPVSVPVAAAAPRKQRVTATVPAQPATPSAVQEETAPSAEEGAPAAQQVPEWHTEGELYEIIKWVLDNGYRALFNGPLTGAEIAAVLDQSEGNGRKVRSRLIKTYAAERGIALPAKASVDQVFAAFGHTLTPVGA
ncbi:DUF2637 domain-containing protein [Streptomyces sp. MT29]|nr:DUF2637 domain-containing protein [Streptomyces sp. MT29]